MSKIVNLFCHSVKAKKKKKKKKIEKIEKNTGSGGQWCWAGDSVCTFCDDFENDDGDEYMILYCPFKWCHPGTCWRC